MNLSHHRINMLHELNKYTTWTRIMSTRSVLMASLAQYREEKRPSSCMK